MRRLVTFLLTVSLATVGMKAQTYTDHLQQKGQGQGTVTVHQSQDITDLVNGTQSKSAPVAKPSTGQQTTKTVPADKADAKTPATKSDNKPAVAKTDHKTETKADVRTPEMDKPASPAEDNASKDAEKPATKKVAVEPNMPKTSTDDAAPVVDTSKKVMRNAYKVDGYRVQAFQGGNTRQDKVKAQQIGSAIKQKFPEQPVYVHFYSPRWICRVGNFRNYQDAARLLKQIRAMGYRSATIVKGKITVQR